MTYYALTVQKIIKALRKVKLALYKKSGPAQTIKAQSKPWQFLYFKTTINVLRITDNNFWQQNIHQLTKKATDKQAFGGFDQILVQFCS